MLVIQIEDILVERIDHLAKLKHSNRSAIVREAIIRFIEDHEDLQLGLSTKRKIKSTKSLKRLRKELNLNAS